MSLLDKGLIKKFVSGGGLGLVRLGTGVIRVKYLAVLLGIGGIGLLAQVTQFHLLSISLTSLSMAAGLINRTRDPARIHNPEMRTRTQSTALTTILILTASYMGPAVYFAEEITAFVFDSQIDKISLYFVLLGLPFAALTSGYFEGIFFSRDRYDLYIRASATAAIIELVGYLALVKLYSFKGAMIAMGLTGPILFVCFFWYLQKLKESNRSLFVLGFDFAEFKEIIKYCIIALSSSALGYFVNLWVRADIIKTLGADTNGLMQPAIALSAYSLPFITNGIWGHLHPAASLTGNTAEGRNELHRVFVLVIGLSGVFAITFITLANIFTRLAFTSQFMTGTALFPYQFTGDYFYFAFFTVNVYFLATSRLLYYFAGWILYYFGLLILVKLLLPGWGMVAYSMSHLLVSILMFFLSLVWLLRNKVLSAASARFFTLALSLVLLCAALKIYEFSYFVTGPVLVLGVYILSSRQVFRVAKEKSEAS